MHLLVRTAAVATLMLPVAGISSAAGFRTRTDALGAKDPRAAFVLDYLCSGRPPFVSDKKVARCPCPVRTTGEPSKEAPGPQGSLIDAIYLGSFTRAKAEQAVVTLFDCVGEMGDTTTLLLEKQGAAWKKVAYKAMTVEEEESRPPRDAREEEPNASLGGQCLTWTDGAGDTRFVCQGGAALFVNTPKGSTLFGVGLVYDAALAPDGGLVSSEPLVRFVDNTHADCDRMPERHRADLAAWSVDTKGKAPRLTLRLDLGQGKTTQHGATPACYADVPATRHVDLVFDWTDAAWVPAAASATEIAALEKVYARFSR